MKKFYRFIAFVCLALCVLVSVPEEKNLERDNGMAQNACEKSREEHIDEYIECISLISSSHPFLSRKSDIVALEIEKTPYIMEYRAFDKLDIRGAFVYAVRTDGSRFLIPNNEITVRYGAGDCFLVGDTKAILEYSGITAELSVSIIPAEYDISSLAFSDKSVIYDGSEHTISPVGNIYGLDSIPLTFSTVGGGRCAGDYSVTLTFSTESPNYVCPAPIVRTLTVEPYELEVIYDGVSSVYDGTAKQPQARVSTLEGKTVFLDVCGSAVNAGIYKASASFGDRNYVLKNPETEFEILKADIDLSSASWTDGELDYNGKIQSVSVLGLPETVILSGYKNAAFSSAGEYIAEAELIYDEKNFNPPKKLTHKWCIRPIEYDVSAFGFSDSSFTYDGENHYPSHYGYIKKGFDESLPEYTFSCGARNVSDGEVRVKISFTSKSENYIAPRDMYATVRVLPKEISVLWEGLRAVYDGEHHTPGATHPECNITVDKSYVNAGKYTVRAIPETENYLILNSEAELVISKAANTWLTLPSVNNIYEGREPSPLGKAKYGEAIFSYFEDYECKNPAKSFLPGTYYMKAEVAAGDNYFSLYSEPLKFSIIAVVPIALEAKITAPKLTALSKISDSDISIYYLNNDGSTRALSVFDAQIVYQNGECLNISDTLLTVSVLGFSKVLEINVSRAVYDMSGTFWSVTETVYDGEVKCPTLSGLPDGVSVEEYSFLGASNAGKYALSAKLSYDEINYEAPILPKAHLVIKRKEVKVPILESFVYDGAYHKPRIEENELYTFFNVSGRDSGEYTVALSLNDPLNYVFENDAYSAVFFIAPKKITVKVNRSADSYKITEGEILEGDELLEEYYSKDGYVYLKALNDNYEVTVIPAKEHGAMGYVWLIFFIVVFLLLLSIAVYFIIRRPRTVMAILDAISLAFSRKRKTVCPVNTGASSINPRLDTIMAVDAAYADNSISNSLARSLIIRSQECISTSGKRKYAVNIDTLSDEFYPGAVIDINVMKERGIIPKDAGSVKILARGVIDKPLTVIANSFSLCAVKMIALTGGNAKKAKTELK